MSGIKETVTTVCITIIVTELIYKFCPQNSMVKFIKALIFVLIFASIISVITKTNFDFYVSNSVINIQGTQLSEYINGKYVEAANMEVAASVEKLLKTVDINAKKIEVFTDIAEDSSILLSRVVVEVKYETEGDRAKALLENALGDDTRVEVRIDGN